MLIEKGNLPHNALEGEVAVVTGAGRGIGFEAARALLWLGAQVAMAEIDENNGRVAAQILEKEFGAGRAVFVRTDVGSEEDIQRLRNEIIKKWEKVDIVLNNAAISPIGAVRDIPVDQWDVSYRVNLRGPVLLAQSFLSDMLKRRHGVFVCVSSSGAAPFMGAYQVFKTAQSDLANTIAAEVEGTGVFAFTIGPGIVRTPGFIESGGQVAAYMGKTLDQLLEMNKDFEISPEAAGAGFAAAIALAQKYHGTEIGSIQALKAIGIELGIEEENKKVIIPKVTDMKRALELFQLVMKTFKEQSEGWSKRNIFERQWVFRDFKKNTNMSVEEMRAELNGLGDNLQTGRPTARFVDPLNKLYGYYVHQQEMLKGFEKITKKQVEGQAIIETWKRDVKGLIETLNA